jgi:F-type H+-transporting ATPase subunit b
MAIFAFAESIQLVPDGTLFLHIAIILVMVLILNKTLFGPINRILGERERRTGGRSSEAREILGRVEESMTRYEHSLRDARTEGYRLLEAQRGEAMSARQRWLEGVRGEVGRTIEEQKEIIHEQAEEARGSLESEARRVASSVSAQILGRPLSGGPQGGARP